MADHLRQTPEQFRKYLESQLISVREELLRAEAVSKKSAATSVKDGDVNVLKKVKSELIAIRKEMASKLEELEAYRQFEREMEGYKKKLTSKLMNLRSEVAKQEEEMESLRTENEQYRYHYLSYRHCGSLANLGVMFSWCHDMIYDMK